MAAAILMETEVAKTVPEPRATHFRPTLHANRSTVNVFWQHVPTRVTRVLCDKSRSEDQTRPKYFPEITSLGLHSCQFPVTTICSNQSHRQTLFDSSLLL